MFQRLTPTLLAGALFVFLPAMGLARDHGGGRSGGWSHSSGGRGYSSGNRGYSSRGSRGGERYSAPRGYSGRGNWSGGYRYRGGGHYVERHRYGHDRGGVYFYGAPYGYYDYAPPAAAACPYGYYDSYGNWIPDPSCYAAPPARYRYQTPPPDDYYDEGDGR